jgi:integrase/recombinase XerC
MPTPFKPDRTYLLPTNAEIVAKDNKPHVRLIEGGRPSLYPVSKDGTKYLKPAKNYVADVRDADGALKRVSLSANMDASRLILAEKLKKIEMERAGWKDTFGTHRKTPLKEHLEEWLAVLQTRGRDDEYTGLKKARVTTIFNGCGFVFPPDLSADRLERFLETLRTGAKALSIQTTNDYLQAVSQFCNWMVENERLERNPFAKLKKGNPERDRRHVRRVLDIQELQSLVTATRGSATIRKKLTGESRALLYTVAAYTGYRAGELAELATSSFRLTQDPPTIDLSGEFTKNGKDASQPIPLELAETLRGFLAGLDAKAKVWPSAWAGRSAEMIQADAEAAGVALSIDTKDGVQSLDFHSLRGTFATLLDSLDISLKGRQELMRHSDPRLTMNRYTRAKLLDLGAAVQSLPKLDTIPQTRLEQAVLQATGTEGGASSGAVPDAVASGSGRLRLRRNEETKASETDPIPSDDDNEKPLQLQGFEDGQGPSRTTENGEGGIRTRGGVLPPRRFSKAVLSTTQPPLLVLPL